VIRVVLAAEFEAAHRLPALGGKCVSLHGHSWRAEFTLTGPIDPHGGTVVEFGVAKSAIRSWVDANLDHASMLGAADPLAGVLEQHGSRVFRFGQGLAEGLAWPTVEWVAELLSRAAEFQLSGHGVRVQQVRVRETRLNTAQWEAA
jgi:6-pyruvoyltetrahydropterin/6-carboxytetrahydropterin synthase